VVQFSFNSVATSPVSFGLYSTGVAPLLRMTAYPAVGLGNYRLLSFLFWFVFNHVMVSLITRYQGFYITATSLQFTSTTMLAFYIMVTRI
jgi:hypothetical protein